MLYLEPSGTIIGAAIEVHRELGPGLPESVYDHCFARELRAAGVPFLQQHPVPVRCKGEQLDMGFRLDLWVDQRIIVEIKAIDLLQGIHRAQPLSYLRLTGCKLGLLIDFNEPLLTGSARRVANGLDES
ncbi:MAG: GxxExxY protein [Flavobacteriales bacterium]|nr:MAG: GxxExxY protein [Flavobacteriales bacterium]